MNKNNKPNLATDSVNNKNLQTELVLKPTKSAAKCQVNKTKNTVATEIGGPQGPEPTRYNDWEKNGRCIDF